MHKYLKKQNKKKTKTKKNKKKNKKKIQTKNIEEKLSPEFHSPKISFFEFKVEGVTELVVSMHYLSTQQIFYCLSTQQMFHGLLFP